MNRFVLTALACCLLLVGCRSEPPLGKAHGKVTFKGAVVTEGSVIFNNDSQGLTYVSDLDGEGNFAFEVARGHGLPPGTYRVAICPPRPNKPSLKFVAPNYKAKTNYPNIPKKYHESKTSGLTAIVESGVNAPYVFDMN